MHSYHNSQSIDNARTIIRNVRGKELTKAERSRLAIELAGYMLTESRRIQTAKEKKHQALIAGMVNDSYGKVFTTSVTDQCFRSNKYSRIADQLVFLIRKYGLPSFLSLDKKLELLAFQWLGKPFSNIFVPLAKKMVRQETSTVILPGEPDLLIPHIKKRKEQGVRINLNHLGEAILGEEEAKRRLDIYLNDLSHPEIEYISVKISTIFSQLNLLDWKDTLSILSDRLKHLYRVAKEKKYIRADGAITPKFVNLDMEEYRDLDLTVDLFMQTLDDPEFLNFSAGIVLQSYLPDSFNLQKKLTEWAMGRIDRGGAPIKIRIVKGANLAMEQVEGSLKGWPQAPYLTKRETDANFKRMLNYASRASHAKAVHLGIASHNLFDIAYGLLLCSENEIEKFACFEMLEGMADHMRRVVQHFSNEMLLYCPAATEEEFQNAVAYLVRRLDENTAAENFLRYSFDMKVGSQNWEEQSAMFAAACDFSENVSSLPRRIQDRTRPALFRCPCAEFENEPDTDWSLVQNRRWAEQIVAKWKNCRIDTIPLVIGGNEIYLGAESEAMGVDPAFPNKKLFSFTLAQENHIDIAFKTAKKALSEWSGKTALERSVLLENAAVQMRNRRSELIGAMIANTGKTIPESDPEVSEAIDFIEYYRRSAVEMHHLQDIEWKPKGVVLIAPPWNFPCSIPAGGIAAALAAGNCVLFKPAIEAVLVGWELAKCFWKAGISKEVLQFVSCEDEPAGTKMIQDPRLDAVVLTGATATAKLFMKMRPEIDLIAETGGKNAMIITNLCDRDLAIKDLIQSAFGHAGQKCSACSLAICEAEIYDDSRFLEHLRDAAASLPVGSQWDQASSINPLIHSPNATLLRGLTTLEEGESWLLEPRKDATHPTLWSPGIKLGVREKSYTHQTELFGPVLSLMRADNLDHAIKLANSTSYGLTSGIHSLDEREHKKWIHQIEAGNCYINRGITGAIVQRQPFGGCKESGFGPGAKAGGPNYVQQLMAAHQITFPKEQEDLPETLKVFSDWIYARITPDQQNLWKASLGSYAFYWKNYFSRDHDPSQVLGQDNILRYLPQKIAMRLQPADSIFDAGRALAAALITGASLEISGEEGMLNLFLTAPWRSNYSISFDFIRENQIGFLKRITPNSRRIRMISPPHQELIRELSNSGAHWIYAPVLANGRLELLHFLREVSISYSYHRYGNLGYREAENILRSKASNLL